MIITRCSHIVDSCNLPFASQISLKQYSCSAPRAEVVRREVVSPVRARVHHIKTFSIQYFSEWPEDTTIRYKFVVFQSWVLCTRFKVFGTYVIWNALNVAGAGFTQRRRGYIRRLGHGLSVTERRRFHRRCGHFGSFRLLCRRGCPRSCWFCEERRYRPFRHRESCSIQDEQFQHDKSSSVRLRELLTD